MAGKRQRPHGTGSLFKRNGRGSWIVSWYDHTGKRRERSTRTTDRSSALRILQKRVADTALRRDGVIDASKDRFAVEGRKPLAQHFGDYIAHCERAGLDPHHVNQKQSHLRRLLEATDAVRLADLTDEVLEWYVGTLRDLGRSARTMNFARQIVVAFMSWCVKKKRAESNTLKVVPKLDEDRDRRRERRPLTDDEFARLLAVASEYGRAAWYLAAALAGLRRGDLMRLSWADIDFENGSITISEGKAKRTDILPVHPQLASELRRLHAERLPMPTAKVFPTAVTAATVAKDFLRAGLAREEVVTDADGEPVMIGKGKRRRPKIRIATEDAQGRVIDLHALRSTLATNLARAGVAPQLTQEIMRHADYRTTKKHYTVLGLADTAAAIAKLPTIEPDRRQAATGTCDTQSDPPQFPRQLGRETVRNGATPCQEHDTRRCRDETTQPTTRADVSDEARDHAAGCETAGDATRTRNNQLGRLHRVDRKCCKQSTYDIRSIRLHQCLHQNAGRDQLRRHRRGRSDTVRGP